MLVFQMLGFAAVVEVGDRTVETGTFDAEDTDDAGVRPRIGVSADWLRRRAPRLVLLTAVLPPPTLPTSRPVNCRILLMDRRRGTMDARGAVGVSPLEGDWGGLGDGIGDIMGDGTGVVTVMEGGPLAE